MPAIATFLSRSGQERSHSATRTPATSTARLPAKSLSEGPGRSQVHILRAAPYWLKKGEVHDGGNERYYDNYGAERPGCSERPADYVRQGLSSPIAAGVPNNKNSFTSGVKPRRATTCVTGDAKLPARSVLDEPHRRQSIIPTNLAAAATALHVVTRGRADPPDLWTQIGLNGRQLD